MTKKNSIKADGLTSRRTVIAAGGAAAFVGGSMALAQAPAGAPAGGAGAAGGGAAAGGAGRAPAAPPTAAEIAAALPLKATRIGHFGMIVPSVMEAGYFWASLFNKELHQEPFNGIFRYYTVLKRGPAEPPLDYIAVGDVVSPTEGTRPTRFDHWCAQLESNGASNAAINAAMVQIGSTGPGTSGQNDVDSIALQLGGGAGGLAGAVRSSGNVLDGDPLFEPTGLAHMIFHVADLNKSIAYYEKLFGVTGTRASSTRAWIPVGTDRIGLEVVPAGEKPKIYSFGVAVKPYNRAAAVRRIEAIGGKIIPTSGPDAGTLRILAPFGLVCDVVTL